jgi:hypothetical protein
MAKPNYQLEKRRRDLEKKAKKEEKKRRKTEAGNSAPADGTEEEPSPPAPL